MLGKVKVYDFILYWSWEGRINPAFTYDVPTCISEPKRARPFWCVVTSYINRFLKKILAGRD